ERRGDGERLSLRLDACARLPDITDVDQGEELRLGRYRQRHVRPEAEDLVLVGEIQPDLVSAGQYELSQLIPGDLPLGVVRRADDQPASKERLAQAALEG